LEAVEGERMQIGEQLQLGVWRPWEEIDHALQQIGDELNAAEGQLEQLRKQLAAAGSHLIEAWAVLDEIYKRQSDQ
jgi:hypothetical protein